MSMRLRDQQPDLLRRAGLSAGHEKLPPEVREAVGPLLKKLLGECVPEAAKASSIDE
jgi:hypothetical protein